MATHTLDTLGLKCPQPILKVAAMAKEIQPGDMLEVLPIVTLFQMTSKHGVQEQIRHFLSVLMKAAGSSKHKSNSNITY